MTAHDLIGILLVAALMVAAYLAHNVLPDYLRRKRGGPR
jgi:hypothetical protein